MNVIQTRDGSYFNFEHPERHTFKVYEIAAALSKLCRFTGNTSHFYSVAQHSVYVSRIVPWELRLAGLLHDAAESVLGDVSSPLKRLLPDYRRIEQRVEKAIADQLGVPFPMPYEVKAADMRMLVTEKRAFLVPTDRDHKHWPDYRPAPFNIGPMSPSKAEEFFIMEFLAIKDGRVRPHGSRELAEGWVGPAA